jgi:hypothetical protein
VQETAVKLSKSKTRQIRLIDKLHFYLRLTLLSLVLSLYAHSKFSNLYNDCSSTVRWSLSTYNLEYRCFEKHGLSLRCSRAGVCPRTSQTVQPSDLSSSSRDRFAPRTDATNQEDDVGGTSCDVRATTRRTAREENNTRQSSTGKSTFCQFHCCSHNFECGRRTHRCCRKEASSFESGMCSPNLLLTVLSASSRSRDHFSPPGSLHSRTSKPCATSTKQNPIVRTVQPTSIKHRRTFSA